MRSRVIVLGLAAFLFSGCLGLSSEATKEDTVVPDITSQGPASAGKDELTSSTKTYEEASALHEVKGHAVSKIKDSGGPGIWLVKHRATATNAEMEAEREQAKAAAANLAKRLPSVSTIRLCYDTKEKEWWISLYEDSGAFFEVRQFIWSPIKDKPEPFLVQQRIARARLEAHLASARKEFTCQVLERSGEKPAVQIEEAKKSKPEKAKEKTSGKKIAGETPPRKPPPRRVEVTIPPRVPESAAAGNGRKAAAAKTPSKPLPTPKAPPAVKEEKVYKLASAGPAQKQIAEKNPARPAMSIEPDYRHAAAGETKLDVAPKISRPKDRADQALGMGPGTKSYQKPAGDMVASVPRQGIRPDERSRRPTYSIFVYGSEMNHSELMAWLEANRYDTSLVADAVPGVLEGYDFVWNYFSPSRHGGAVNLEPRSGSKIWGLLIEVEDKLLDAFDKKAGHPIYYSRGDERVPVTRIQDGRTVFAWLYLAKPNKGGKKDIWPTRDYKSRVLEAAMFWDFPEEYIRKIRDWPTR